MKGGDISLDRRDAAITSRFLRSCQMEMSMLDTFDYGQRYAQRPSACLWLVSRGSMLVVLHWKIQRKKRNVDENH
ncbi:hypothetical protein L204_103092 [Cryptococcus depauperatus]